MVSLVLKMSVSLDGYAASLDGSSDWETAGRSEDGAAWVLETVSNAATHLVGAATYARWAASWPRASGPFAKPMNEIPKIVFSNSHPSTWGPELTSGNGGSRSGGEILSAPVTVEHFDIYVGEHFERAISEQLAFLQTHVPAAAI